MMPASLRVSVSEVRASATSAMLCSSLPGVESIFTTRGVDCSEEAPLVDVMAPFANFSSTLVRFGSSGGGVAAFSSATGFFFM